MVCRGSCSPARISFACVLPGTEMGIDGPESISPKASERNLLLSGNQSVNQHQGLGRSAGLAPPPGPGNAPRLADRSCAALIAGLTCANRHR